MEADWFQWLTEGFLLMVLGVIGLVGNTCSMALFARQRIQRVFHHLLLLLAIFDARPNLTTLKSLDEN
ncbi:hypothetical protein TCAL_15948 [Tigriopus californicus]|uniref:G-protein coupled receptors family 1 profile domain-containing protein n=1 Tax=Tigriopus californicus TaxID=6832 RepID=A0A553PFG2_TIGCA|nr:hypothetical protein TCAL_15948 [Tigriopus californicus]